MAKAFENHERKPLSYDGTNVDILPTQAGLCITVPNLWVAAVDLVVNAIAGNPISGYYIPTLSPYRSWLYYTVISNSINVDAIKSSKKHGKLHFRANQVHLMKSEVVTG